MRTAQPTARPLSCHPAAGLPTQVAMLADSNGAEGEGTGGAKAVPARRAPPGVGDQPAPPPPGVPPSAAALVGWLLAHRKALVGGYLALLHLLVYFALTHGVFSFSAYGAPASCDDAVNQAKAAVAAAATAPATG